MSDIAARRPQGPCTAHRRAHSTGLVRLSALLAGLVLAASAHASSTITGSLRLQLSLDNLSGETLDFSAWPDLANLRLTSVRAKFSAEVLGDMHNESQAPGDYTLLNKERVINTPPNCYGLPVAWCGVERYYYSRDVVKTLTQSDSAQMQVGIGSVVGSDNNKGTLTESSLQNTGTTEETKWQVLTDNTDPNAIGQLEVFKYYTTYNYQQTIWSSKSQLSVTLDLDAATLTELSSTGHLRYDGFAQLIYRPTLQLDYEAVSTVPEPGSTAMTLAGLTLLAGAGMRRRRRHLSLGPKRPVPWTGRRSASC